MADPVFAQLPAEAEQAWEAAALRWRASMESEGMVGASLALVDRTGLAALETFGHAEIATGGATRDVPVDDATIYHWASITKTFTAISILQLRDRGLLDLDDPIVRYVPELAGVSNPYGPMEAVTIRHLLSHSAGFRGGTWPWGGDQDWHPHEPTEWSQLVAMIPYTRIHFEPGSRFSYSNPGIIWLGRVIETVTGDVFEAYVDKNVFRPLGMHRSYFDGTPWHLLDHRANHYWIGAGGARAGGRDFNTGITVSNGGLNAPVGDLARYVAFLLGGMDQDPDAAGVLARASLEEMWRTVVPIGDSELGTESMGLSFFLYETPGGRLVGHTGTQRAYYSFLLFDPDAGVGVLGAFNSVGEDGGPPRTAELRIRTRADVAETVFPAAGRSRP
ncbi:MAG: serine hydrolase domain-containing protein [Longimicrobiales bacterium]